MTKFCTRASLAFVLAFITVGFTAAQQRPIDGTLYTIYGADILSGSVSWSVCGSLPGSGGCYGGGTVGTFGKIGAMIEGSPTTQGGVVRRYIYILDLAAGDSGSEVTLNVFTKTDTIAHSLDTVTVTLSKTVSLPLAGGTNATSFMAANDNFLFIGTDQTPFAVEVAKGNFSIQQISEITGANTSSITADQYGYVTVTFGNPTLGFGIWDRTGSSVAGGGGPQLMLDTVNGVQPSSIPWGSK